jgi:hypothetical protein
VPLSLSLPVTLMTYSLVAVMAVVMASSIRPLRSNGRIRSRIA